MRMMRAIYSYRGCCCCCLGCWPRASRTVLPECLRADGGWNGSRITHCLIISHRRWAPASSLAWHWLTRAVLRRAPAQGLEISDAKMRAVVDALVNTSRTVDGAPTSLADLASPPPESTMAGRNAARDIRAASTTRQAGRSSTKRASRAE